MFYHNIPSGILTIYGISLTVQFILFMTAFGAELSATAEKISDIIKGMNAAYADLDSYQTETVVRVFRDGLEVENERFLYTFKKPNHIRIDMESPSSGTVLIYPDENGKVFVKPGGTIGFLRLHLSPGSALLRASEGQRIDQTDIGLLIQNIGRSLTDWRRGEIKISNRGKILMLDVLSKDHFLSGVLTQYQFYIDETRWLPVEVRELTPDGSLKREVVFQNLKTSVAIPDGFFMVDKEKSDSGQPSR